MSSAPLIAWVEREVRAQVEAIAQARNIAVERAAGELLAKALERIGAPQPVLPDLSQPSDAAQRQALREAGAESIEALGRPRNWRPERTGRGS